MSQDDAQARWRARARYEDPVVQVLEYVLGLLGLVQDLAELGGHVGTAPDMRVSI